MKFIILHEAEIELKDAIVFYNDQLCSLDDKFYDKILMIIL
jgi:hypothetical protein